MIRIISVVLALATGAFLPGCSSMQSMAGQSEALTSLITQQLGVTDAQASGGVGSMLKLAQEKLSAGDFDKVAKVVPGASKYLDSARQLLGGGNVGSMAGLQSAFSRLGLDAGMIDKFKPILTQFVSTAGSPETGSLLAGVLK